MPTGQGSGLVLPSDKVDTFLSNVERHAEEDKPFSNWQTYTLKKGERIDTVAARYGLSGSRLRQINGITARTKVGPGHALLVPGKGAQGNPNLLAVSLPDIPPDPPRAGKRGHKSAKAHGRKHVKVSAGTSVKKTAAKSTKKKKR
jgi:membrane-bound lytic murein transglycosylase D